MECFLRRISQGLPFFVANPNLTVAQSTPARTPAEMPLLLSTANPSIDEHFDSSLLDLDYVTVCVPKLRLI